MGVCSTAYANINLPANNFNGPTAFGYWDDLYIKSQTSQNIYYAVSGTMPNRTTTFEFYTTYYGQYTQYYHFQILFYENMPNVVKYVYFEASDGGASATIGVQSKLLILVFYKIYQPNNLCRIIDWTQYNLFC